MCKFYTRVWNPSQDCGTLTLNQGLRLHRLHRNQLPVQTWHSWGCPGGLEILEAPLELPVGVFQTTKISKTWSRLSKTYLQATSSTTGREVVKYLLKQLRCYWWWWRWGWRCGWVRGSQLSSETTQAMPVNGQYLSPYLKRSNHICNSNCCRFLTILLDSTIFRWHCDALIKSLVLPLRIQTDESKLMLMEQNQLHIPKEKTHISYRYHPYTYLIFVTVATDMSV